MQRAQHGGNVRVALASGSRHGADRAAAHVEAFDHESLEPTAPSTCRPPDRAIPNEWSLFTRDIEDGAVALARELGIGILPYSPLGRGWLSGRIRSRDDVSATHRQHPRFSQDAFERNRVLADTVATVATEIGAQPGQVALAWVISRGDDVAPTPGTRHVEYLRENVGAASIELGEAHLERLDRIAARVAGHRSIRPENLGTEVPLAVSGL